MSIPLAKDNSKDSINTSIIAIKRQIERINMLLGLVDSGNDPDLSGFATKTELQDAVTELDTEIAAVAPVDEVTVDNMHSVTSNAVAVALARKNLFSGAVTSTSTQYSLSGKISDYKWIVISGLDANTKVRGTVVLPAISLQNGFNIACYWNNGVTGLFGTYVDDTHLNISAADAAKIKYCTIHGIFS